MIFSHYLIDLRRQHDRDVARTATKETVSIGSLRGVMSTIHSAEKSFYNYRQSYYQRRPIHRSAPLLQTSLSVIIITQNISFHSFLASGGCVGVRRPRSGGGGWMRRVMCIIICISFMRNHTTSARSKSFFFFVFDHPSQHQYNCSYYIPHR